MGWLFTQLVWNRPSSSGKAPADLEKHQLINKNYKFYHASFCDLKKKLFNFFKYSFVFCGFILRSKINHNVISLSHTSIVRCPSLDGDWSSGDHVPIPGWVTPQILIHTVSTVISVRCSHLAADITDISCTADLQLQFFVIVLMGWVIIDPVQQRDGQLRHHLCQVSAVLDILCGVVSWLYCVCVLFKSVMMYLLVRLFAPNHAETTTVHIRIGTSVSVTSWPAHLGIDFPVCI